MKEASELLETNPKTGRTYSLPKVLADAVLRPRGERSRDVNEFQKARARQTLSGGEREELESAIRAELHIQRARTERVALYLKYGCDVSPKWVEQFRIKRKGKEIAAACRAGRAVLSYGMHGEKADSRTFHFVALPESLAHATRDREPQWESIRLSIFTKLAAYYSTRRGGRTQYAKDCAKFRRVVELIVSSRPAAGEADLTVEDLLERMELGTSNARVQKARMRERLEEGAARLRFKRNLRACMDASRPPARPTVALADIPLTLGECLANDDCTRAHAPYARACIEADKAELRRYSAHGCNWPLAAEYVAVCQEELIALRAFMQGARA